MSLKFDDNDDEAYDDDHDDADNLVDDSDDYDTDLHRKLARSNSHVIIF